MSVTTRTNRATNPSVTSASTGWAFVAGTGGAGSGARNTGAGSDGIAGFFRSTWTTATTGVSGGASFTQTALSAATQYRLSIYARSSKAQTVRLRAAFQNSSATTVNTANGSAVAIAAGTWTRIDVLGTSGALVDRVVATLEATTGGSNWAIADTLDVDCLLIEQTAILNPYFDGDYTGGLGRVYAWTGTANASSSTDTLYAPVLTLTPKTDAPCARVDITIADLAPSNHTVTLWRTADGRRRTVRSYESVVVQGSDFTTDYEPPLNRAITYEIEVTSGVGVGGPDGSGTVTVAPSDVCGYIQDPLNPESAIKVYATVGPAGEPVLMPSAISKLDYVVDQELVHILGGDEPVALLGQRMKARNVPFEMFTDAAAQALALRNLLLAAPMVLIRPGVGWDETLPGLCYVAPPSITEAPEGLQFGSPYTTWKFEGTLLAAPTMNIVIPVWTYQDWAALWATYQAAQTALSGKTYLAVRRSPTNGV